MTEKRALYTEEAVGANHPTKTDVINRLTLIQHDTDGTHLAAALTTLLGLTYARIKQGTFIRDTTTGSGNQGVTGVGFKPKAVVFISTINATSSWSVGLDDGSSSGSIVSIAESSPDQVNPVPGVSIYAFSTAGTYAGTITTLDSDGFTIAWTKASTQSGTIIVYYLAFR